MPPWLSWAAPCTHPSSARPGNQPCPAIPHLLRSHAPVLPNAGVGLSGRLPTALPKGRVSGHAACGRLRRLLRGRRLCCSSRQGWAAGRPAIAGCYPVLQALRALEGRPVQATVQAGWAGCWVGYVGRQQALWCRLMAAARHLWAQQWKGTNPQEGKAAHRRGAAAPRRRRPPSGRARR